MREMQGHTASRGGRGSTSDRSPSGLSPSNAENLCLIWGENKNKKLLSCFRNAEIRTREMTGRSSVSLPEMTLSKFRKRDKEFVSVEIKRKKRTGGKEEKLGG